MDISAPSPRRASAVLLVVVLCVAACGGPVSADPEQPSVLMKEAGGLRYTYHVPSATEGLFDLGADPSCLVNLIERRREDALVLRLRLAADLGVRDLNDLHTADDPVRDRLAGNGYF